MTKEFCDICSTDITNEGFSSSLCEIGEKPSYGKKSMNPAFHGRICPTCKNAVIVFIEKLKAEKSS